MSDAPATLEYDPADSREAALQRRLALLDQLAEAGLRLALTIEAEAAQAAAAGQPVPSDAAMAFSRAARAVRLTVLLQAKLEEEPQARASGAGADGAEDGSPGEAAAPPDLYVPAEVRRGRQVLGIVRGVAEAAGRDAETVERLAAEAGERMRRDDIYYLVRTKPFGELVTFICKELGLDPDWDRLVKEAWEKAEEAGVAARWSYHLARATKARGPGRRRPAQGAAGHFAPAFHGSS
jgi:hypothetical protein